MLNGFQQKVAGAAILCLSVCAIGGFAIAALKIAGAFLDKFGAVVWPLALAVILSFILKPAVDFMAVKMKVGRTAACWIMIAALALAAAAASSPSCPRSCRKSTRFAPLFRTLWRACPRGFRGTSRS